MRRMARWIAGLCAAAALAAAPAGRAVAVETAQLVITDGKQIALYAESHALLVGVSDYTNGWPKLRGVPDDIAAVGTALTSVGFATEVVADPDRAGIDRAITSFIARWGGKAENRLLIYYAGHGHTLKTAYGEDMGYIVPRDAPDPNKDRSGFMAGAISMQTVEVYARQIEAKHAMFVFDSCFSGSVFHPTRAIPEFVQEKSAYPVRQFITSGAADQPVPDFSIFRREFVRAITGQADLGKDGYFTGSQLGMYLEEKVTGYSKRTQTPQYGKLQDPNLDRGDFIFILPNARSPSAGPQATSAADPGPNRSAPSPGRTDREAIFWQSIEASTDAADFQAYLQKFPDGDFAPLARNRLAALATPKPTPGPAPSPAASPPAGNPAAGAIGRALDLLKRVELPKPQTAETPAPVAPEAPSVQAGRIKAGASGAPKVVRGQSDDEDDDE